MSGPRSVLVVGGGVVGLCAAYYALRAGRRVTVVERGGAGHEGCSLGNAGMVVPSHFVPLAAPGMVGLGLRMLRDPAAPFAIRLRPDPGLLSWAWRFCRAAREGPARRAAPLLRDLGLASLACFAELEEELGGAFRLERRGLLMLCEREETLREEAAVADRARELGLAAAVLTPEEAARLEPGLRPACAGAVYFEGDCHLDPGRLMAALAGAVEARGGRICRETEVTGWRAAGGRLSAVVTSRGEMEADDFVAAAGSWTAGLLRRLGLRLPLQAGKGYSITLPRPPRLPRVPAILVEARVAVTPMGSSLRFAGTMELGGLDLSVDRRRVEGMVRAAARCFPDFTPADFRGLPAWSGLRPCSPDGLPYVGRAARFPNLLVATGHAMLGVSLGPVTGRLVAEMLAGETPSLDVKALRPDRYG